jgi:uroporphyrinogen decarboxylase
MNSKERVRCAVNRTSVDQVPTDFSATGLVVQRLQKHFDTDDYNAVLDHLDIDIRQIFPKYIGPELKRKDLDEHTFEVEGVFGDRSTYSWNGKEHHGVVTHHPLKTAQSPEEIYAYSWPNTDWWDFSSIKEDLDRFESRSILCGHWGPFQSAFHLRPEESIYTDMAGDEDLAIALFSKHHTFEMEFYEKLLQAGEGRIDILRTHDDYGTQRSMLFSNEMWRTYFAQHTKDLVDLAHRHGAFFMQHSCGAIRNIIPELIEVGVDIIDPIQPGVGMDPEGLYRDFGGKICFHGGIDTQHLLPKGNPAQVKAEVRRYIDALHHQGGYILYPSQAFESDVPVENILALYQIRN